MPEYVIKTPMWAKDRTLYRPGRRQVSDAHATELGLLASTESTADAGDGTDPGSALSGVDFASEAAREAARDAGLTASDFKGASPSSPNGYTKPDVTAILEAKG